MHLTSCCSAHTVRVLENPRLIDRRKPRRPLDHPPAAIKTPWLRCGAVLLSAFMGACRTGNIPLPTPEPLPPVRAESTTMSPPRRTFVLRNDSAVYEVTSTVMTSEVSGTGTVSDSVIFREMIRVSLAAAGNQRFSISFLSDSGYRLPSGRTIPLDLARKAHTPARAIATIDQTSSRVVGSVTAPDCSQHASLVSPALSYIMGYAVLRRTGRGSVSDSLSYSTCSSGVVTSNHMVVMWQEETSADSSSGALRGSVSADSSRALPMKSIGRFTGTTTVLSAGDSTVLPHEFELRTETQLTVTSAAREQSFRQRVWTKLIRR